MSYWTWKQYYIMETRRAARRRFPRRQDGENLLRRRFGGRYSRDVENWAVHICDLSAYPEPAPDVRAAMDRAFALAVRTRQQFRQGPYAYAYMGVTDVANPEGAYFRRFSDGCTICQYGFVGGQVIYHFPCQHVFHAVCASGWLNTWNWCPNCRGSVVVLSG